MRSAILILLVLAGCSKPPPPVVHAVEPPSQVEPLVTIHEVDGNQLIVMKAVTKSDFGIQESQTCFVFRDREYKASSLSCPADPVFPSLAH